MKQITATSEFSVTDILTQERELLFITVAWSGYVAQSAAVVNAAIAKWNDNPANDPLIVFSIDLSDQQGVLWDAVVTWLNSEGVDTELQTRVLFGGYGALLWIRDGKIAQYSTYPAHDGVDFLLEQTRLWNGQSDPRTKNKIGDR